MQVMRVMQVMQVMQVMRVLYGLAYRAFFLIFSNFVPLRSLSSPAFLAPARAEWAFSSNN